MLTAQYLSSLIFNLSIFFNIAKLLFYFIKSCKYTHKYKKIKVLHFNDGKKKHAGIFSQMGLDVGIHSHIYY